mmetsp:Transcript_43959/g.68769  ORF Transcript_43959/g.68769 Transcript_43959/m.68769 type:complete len:137 (-) Transcript_43959:72-482(-)
MSALTQFGHTGGGLISQKLRDIDAAAPRARLPPRALPDSVRSKMKLPPREGAPLARRNWEAPEAISTKEALFGDQAKRDQRGGGWNQGHGPEAEVDQRRKVGITQGQRVPKNQGRRAKSGSFNSPYQMELRMHRLP